jgi:hypothetical protein
MGRKILADTDVMIDYLRGHAQAVALLKMNASDVILSAITVAELYAGVRDGSEREVLDNLISIFTIIPVTPQSARAAGLLKRDYGKSHGTGLADAMIAVAAQTQNARLCTLNTKHYPMLSGIKPAYTKR